MDLENIIMLLLYSISLVLALIIVVISIRTEFSWEWVVISVLTASLIFDQIEIVSLKRKAQKKTNALEGGNIK